MHFIRCFFFLLLLFSSLPSFHSHNAHIFLLAIHLAVVNFYCHLFVDTTRLWKAFVQWRKHTDIIVKKKASIRNLSLEMFTVRWLMGPSRVEGLTGPPVIAHPLLPFSNRMGIPSYLKRKQQYKEMTGLSTFDIPSLDTSDHSHVTAQSQS